MAEPPGILEFFAGRDVLVTGATGYMGKVLVEKLLRCCPDLRRLYVLIRPKKGVSPAARVKQMANLPVFKLISGKPGLFAKIHPLEGDVGATDLGLSAADQERIFEDVSVVFHMAASLNFNAPLKEAVEDNTTGTKRILDFGCRMKKLVSFVYVSTAFCICEQAVVEERVYPPRADPHAVMSMCKGLDSDTLRKITPTLLGAHPNCYTFTKHLAEALVQEYHSKIPLTITRPSIVIPALREPVPGWVDNINGATGFLLAAGKGVLRSVFLDPTVCMEVIPVDICTNVFIIAAYRRSLLSSDESKELPVYNFSSNKVARWTFQDLAEVGLRAIHKHPFQTVLWYPQLTVRKNKLVHDFIVFFSQTVPAYIVDFVLAQTGHKPFLVHVQQKISNGLHVLEYFRTRGWDFRNEKTMTLWTHLNERDKEIFFVNNVLPVDRESYMKDFILGVRQYYCHEPLSTLEQNRRQQQVLYFVHHVFLLFLYITCGWLLLNFCRASYRYAHHFLL